VRDSRGALACLLQGPGITPGARTGFPKPPTADLVDPRSPASRPDTSPIGLLLSTGSTGALYATHEPEAANRAWSRRNRKPREILAWDDLTRARPTLLLC